LKMEVKLLYNSDHLSDRTHKNGKIDQFQAKKEYKLGKQDEE